jgi:hypothetical protein
VESSSTDNPRLRGALPRFDFGAPFKVGAALKPAAGSGGTPAKLV